MSNIVVFGANGFIGKHLVRKLANNPENFVRAFDRFPEFKSGSDTEFHDLENVEIFPGNFLNKSDLSEALKNIDYVFHLVSATNPALSANNPYIDIESNVHPTVTLFELCVQNGVKRVIFPSSGGTVYGDTEYESIDENVVPQPISPYGIGKLTIEHYLRYFKRTHGLDYLVLRIANPYGPGQNVNGKQGVIPIFLQAALNNSPINIYGDGQMVRDYIFITDLIDMIHMIYAMPHQHDVYNLGSGHGASVTDIVKSIESAVGHEIKTLIQPTPATYVQRSVLDITRFSEEFDYTPAIDITDGIRQTWSSLVNSAH